MKKVRLTAALAAIFAGVTMGAYAANPFSDVSADDWAFKAVSDLSEQNVVEGYPDGTFRGNKNVSRYELAQVIARLMEKRDRLTAVQQAQVDQLSAAYADELTSLGVRVAALEKKVGHTELITELRIQDVDRYDNIYKNSKAKHNELSARIRLNTITAVNDRSTLYGQLETYISMNGNDLFDPNKYNYNSDKTITQRSGHGDGELHLNRLLMTYQFGKKQDTTNLPLGPTKNLIGIGQFPVTMGVTGYTYDGEFKGAFLQLGDYMKGGHLTLAYGRATNINYDYTGPMMHGVNPTAIAKQKLGKELATNQVIQNAVAVNPALKPLIGQATDLINSSKNLDDLQKNLDDLQKNLTKIVGQIGAENPELAEKVEKVEKKLAGMNLGGLVRNSGMEYDASTDTLYPMGRDVMMDWGDDEDVPAFYVSYIYKVPQKWEFHAYVAKANGPVGNICKAYGFAGAYNVTPMWNLHGEYIKNLRRLPLNDERPYSFNYGITYGNAHVLKPKSFSIGLDYIYSQAGAYFGGSGNDIVDQYMGHVYTNWNGMRMPAYFADKMDALTDGDESNDHNNFGGAKFFLAKAQYVPMKGLIIEADYGFKARDMGGRKMDDMLLLKATAYIK
ncbi:MAG: S-layer homology domain-containing protein [Dialister sp.]|nr:S-layer homology domain-containing protein [Dialister sp.]